MKELARVDPFVQRLRGIDPLVALEADEARVEQVRQDLGDLGLADARLTLEKDRPAHVKSEMEGGPQAAVGEVRARLEGGDEVVDGGDRRCPGHAKRLYAERRRGLQTKTPGATVTRNDPWSSMSALTRSLIEAMA